MRARLNGGFGASVGPSATNIVQTIERYGGAREQQPPVGYGREVLDAFLSGRSLDEIKAHNPDISRRWVEKALRLALRDRGLKPRPKNGGRHAIDTANVLAARP